MTGIPHEPPAPTDVEPMPQETPPGLRGARVWDLARPSIPWLHAIRLKEPRGAAGLHSVPAGASRQKKGPSAAP